MTNKKTTDSARENDRPSAASLRIDQLIDELDDWRGEMLETIRNVVIDADPGITEEWKYRGTPVWYCDGMVCTGEVYKAHVKMTFIKGASLDDPDQLFNGTKGGGTWRAIDIREGDAIDAKALTRLVRRAIEANRDK